MNLINLNSEVATVESRTIAGKALSFNQTYSQVHNLPPFTFTRDSVNKTLRENDRFQLHWQHKESSSLPLGVVVFHPTETELLYEATFSKTRAADEVLELINDGALTDVSIGFAPIKKRPKPLTFTEIKLYELSIVDKGALFDAKIHEAFSYDLAEEIHNINQRRLRLAQLSRY